MGDYKMEQYTEELAKLAGVCRENGTIDSELYGKYHVKRGLRDLNGEGVVAGLTRISTIKSKEEVNGEMVPCDGVLRYRGIDVTQLCKGFIANKRLGFEETAYLLLFGKLPNQGELDEFKNLLAESRTLPTNFVRDIIMKASSADMMNTLSKSVLALAAYDDNTDDISLQNVLKQCLKLISVFPMLAVYGYHAYGYYDCNNSFYIHHPSPELSTAENILKMLRPDQKYSALEATVLDLALILHMEHGGGNNSSFTTHVVTSSGSDTYSVIAAALGSLKGPKHGGANIKVVRMFDDLENTVKDLKDEEEVADYLKKLLHKEAFDHAGLIYGMGHAVYSLSDPRAQLLKSFVEKLAREKGREEEYQLYKMVETMAPRIIAEERHIYKGVSANVDFYSGFIYSMLDIPVELFTPMFAIARIVGWSAHRLEELINQDKIIRPAYKSVIAPAEYVEIEDRL